MSPAFDAVIFDMDGTVIEPLLDFRAIRSELQLPANKGILESLEDLPSGRRAECHRMLLSHEL